MLTTGSKELHIFCRDERLRKRLIVRVLPGMESLSLCYENGLEGNQIIAMQGPFSEEINTAIYRQYDIRHMVTKESGAIGGMEEKLSAARKMGIRSYVIARPKTDTGNWQIYDEKEILAALEDLLGCRLQADDGLTEENEAEVLTEADKAYGQMHVALVGIGMGAEDYLTCRGKGAILNADYIFGASRIIEPFSAGVEKYPYYLAADIVPKIKELLAEKKRGNIAILFSGDTGFYSGAEAVYKALQEEVRLGKLQAGITICPGISSLSYLAARAGKSWQDAKIVSTHGREADVTAYVRSEENVFLIVSGRSDLIRIGEELEAAGLSGVELTIGYQLSYKEERIWHGTPEVCRTLKDDGLYACLIENPGAQGETLAPGVPDRWFVRGRVPMTKEEIRWLSLCRLGLKSQSVFYDIGSGTGSIAVEAALRSKQLRVYAVEHGEEACGLIAENASRAGVKNLVVVKGEAPECLGELPVPTHAFIGGSGGRLREILLALREKNPNVRVVLNAVSLETVAEVVALWKELLICEEEITQIAVSRAKKAGSHHLMQAENPIYVISFSLSENGEGEEQKPDRREER